MISGPSMTNSQRDGELSHDSHNPYTPYVNPMLSTASSGGDNSINFQSGASHLSTSSTPNSGRGQNCCLNEDGRRCSRAAGNASYSKRIQKTVSFKKLRLEQDSLAHHTYICDFHKTMIQSARTTTARPPVVPKKESEDEVMNEVSDEPQEIDFCQLQVNTLRRIKKHFKIPTRPGLNKAQLSEILNKYIGQIPVDEKEVISYFIYTVKSGRNRLDNRQADQTNTNNTEFMDRY